MKKLLVIAVAVVLSSCTQTKVAYIDVETIMKEYEAATALETEFAGQQQQMTLELQSLQAPFQEKVQEYENNLQTMSASAKAQKEQELQQEWQMIQARQQQISQQLQQDNQVKSEVLIKTIDSLVADYSKAKGFNLVLGTQGNGTVMYGDDALNITTDIITMLNENYSAE